RVRGEQVMLLVAAMPELEVILEPNKATVSGRMPSEALARSLRSELSSRMNVFVSAQDLEVDTAVNLEDWLVELPEVLARFFAGAEEGRFVLRDGLLEVSRELESEVDRQLYLADLQEWLPATRFSLRDSMEMSRNRPIEMTFSKRGTEWTVDGYVPDFAMRDAIVSALEAADASARVNYARITVDENLERPSWMQQGRLERFLRFFSQTVVGSPTMEIRSDGVTLRGQVKNQLFARSNLRSQANETFGYDLAVDLEEVEFRNDEIDEARWVRFDLNQEKVVITGALPSDYVRRTLGKKMREAYPQAKLEDDRVQIELQQDEPWMSSMGSFFAAMAQLTTQGGTVDISGQKAFLNGMARSEYARSALVGKLEQALGERFEVVDALLVDPQRTISDRAIRVFFGFGKTSIPEEEHAKLKKAMDQIEEAGSDAYVLVQGFASSIGSVDANIRISQERAKAVYRALLSMGVDEGVLRLRPGGVDQDLKGQEARRVEIYIR
ncbi:MAG: OmpA family protein, partial [Verrucomicrobiota bacterium]